MCTHTVVFQDLPDCPRVVSNGDCRECDGFENQCGQGVVSHEIVAVDDQFQF